MSQSRHDWSAAGSGGGPGPAGPVCSAAEPHPISGQLADNGRVLRSSVGDRRQEAAPRRTPLPPPPSRPPADPQPTAAPADPCGGH